MNVFTSTPPDWNGRVPRLNLLDAGAIQRSKLPHTPLTFDPGERWQYGGNIDWVGRIVQAVSGEPLDAHFRKYIFEPLDMNDTGYRHFARCSGAREGGHRRQFDGSLKAEPMGHPPKWPPAPQSFSGGGGICSSAPDYLTPIHMLMNGSALNGVRILRPDTVALMGQNQIGRIDGHMITTEPVAEGRSAGSLTWAGIYNTYYWTAALFATISCPNPIS